MPVEDIRSRTDAALELASASLRKEKRFTEAYHLTQLLLRRGSGRPDKLDALIRCAQEADLLQACADFLIGLAYQRPDDRILLNYVAGLLGTLERKDESRRFAQDASRLKPFFPALGREKPQLRLVVLQCAATGDYRYSTRSKRFFMPGVSDLYTLLDPKVACNRLLVDDLPAALKVLDALPPCDLIFNAISDPDYCKSLVNAATICDRARLPVFNDPRRVRMVNRESFPGLLRDSRGIMAPKSVSLPPDRTSGQDIEAAVREAGFDFPVIVRAPGFQGGKHMALVREPSEIDPGLYRGNGLYVIEFVDVAMQDERAGETPLYPKYRAFWVNGTLYPMHLFFADQYEVHKKTSDPVHARFPWLGEYQAAFLEDPARHLPPGRWDALRLAMASIGLDYCGVDFAVSTRSQDAGNLVLFECNPSMRNWLTLLPEGDPVQRKWRSVTMAALEAMCAKAGVEPWPFSLKSGT